MRGMAPRPLSTPLALRYTETDDVDVAEITQKFAFETLQHA